MSLSKVFHRDLKLDLPRLVKAEGIYLELEDGRKIVDGSAGASVGGIGWGNRRVLDAISKEASSAPYAPSFFFTTEICETAARELIETTHGHMARAYIAGSGSEVVEAALKLARQYWLEVKPPQPQRIHYIGRLQSFHGTTLGGLSVGGHKFRRKHFEPMMLPHTSKVSPCYAFRGKQDGETDADYAARLAKELDDEFQRVGPETVVAFIAEPVVGATLGCVPSVEGYFPAMRAVCDKYGALFIADEVMCGMGRSGTTHAWEQLGFVPDIQTVAKGLGGGYAAVGAVLANHRVIDAIREGSSAFAHGHTYQGSPSACAAMVEVQRIIREQDLLNNVRRMGALLASLLRERLGSHPNVGDIRGTGLFWGIEFVADKASKTPFPVADHVAMEINELGLQREHSILVYPGAGTADGVNGDHIIVSPAYNVTREEVEMIVSRVSKLIEQYFEGKARR